MNDKIQASIAELLKPRSVLTIMVFLTACILSLNRLPIPALISDGCKGLFIVWFGEKALKYLKNGGAQ